MPERERERERECVKKRASFVLQGFFQILSDKEIQIEALTYNSCIVYNE